VSDEPLLTAEGVTKHFPVKGGGVIDYPRIKLLVNRLANF